MRPVDDKCDECNAFIDPHEANHRIIVIYAGRPQLDAPFIIKRIHNACYALRMYVPISHHLLSAVQ